MKIENAAEINAPILRVWEFFNDVPRVAGCLPGGELTKVVDDRTYEGIVKVKVGPIAMTYQGNVVLETMDADAHTVLLRAAGRDRRGAGTARATVEATLTELAADRTAVAVVSDLHLTGKVASLGGRGIRDVSMKLFAEFVDRVTAELESPPPEPEPPATEAEPPQSGSAEPEPEPEHEPERAGGAESTAAASAGRGAAGRHRSNEIRIGGLVWSVLLDKLRRLFRIGGKDRM